MIVLDIETSGLSPDKSGIWQIGALDIYNPSNTFLEEARIDDEDLVEEGALKVTGKTEIELRDKNKQSQKQLIINFFKWCESVKIRTCLCQNPQFDLGFIWSKSTKYSLNLPFHYRSFDLHSIAQTKHFEIHNNFLMEGDKSNMGLGNILKFTGMQDNRKAHNALEDVKLTAECFFRIFYGKNLFPEFENFTIPDYLKKDNKND